MSQQPAGKPKRGLPPIVFILIGLGALWGLQSHWAKLLGWRPSLPTISGVNTTSGVNSMLPGGSGAGGNLAAQFPPQQSVPAGTTITIDGSTSMVLINQALKAAFLQAYPGTVVNTSATGSDNGIQALLGGSVTLAALSRPLTAEEQQRGLVAVPVAKDRIAIVVGAACGVAGMAPAAAGIGAGAGAGAAPDAAPSTGPIYPSVSSNCSNSPLFGNAASFSSNWAPVDLPSIISRSERALAGMAWLRWATSAAPFSVRA